MSHEPESDGGADADRALMDALVSAEGRSDPHGAAREHLTLGCRYEVVERVLRDPRTGAAVIPAPDVPLFDLLRRFMARLDGERHRAVRARFARIFTPKKAALFAEFIEQRCHSLLDTMAAAGDEGDLVAGFARPLPFGVVADVLGVPLEDRAWVQESLDRILASFANQRDPDAVTLGSTVTEEVLAYFEDLLAARRATPADDLLSVLAAEDLAGDAHQDLLANCVFFLTAGHATTTALLAGGAALLCENRSVVATNSEEPSQWDATVEELLRYLSPITITGVSVPEPVDVAGTMFESGPNRFLSYAAANRDASVFDAPDEFDPSRPPTPHLAFAVGPHHCLGAPLARLHGRIGLRVLFNRFPDLRVIEGPVWRSSTPVRQVEHLRVRW